MTIPQEKIYKIFVTHLFTEILKQTCGTIYKVQNYTEIFYDNVVRGTNPDTDFITLACVIILPY